MDEEGDVVYFETSPAAEELRSFNTIGDVTNNILPSGLRTNIETKRILDNGRNHWRQLMQRIRQFIVSRWSEELQIQRLIRSIIDSSLLTEEDIQLLEFTLNSALLTTTSTNTPTKYTPITYSLIVAIFILLMAILGNANFLLILIVSLVTMATIFLLIKVDQFHRVRTKLYGDRIMGYVCEMETLLSLLTQGLRMIQERELVYHGFTRPTIRGVPVSRIERRSRSYQCVQLRERIYQTCNDGIQLIRGITHVLVETYQLNMELDDRHSYLAYRDLTDLHSNEDKNNILSLESLKNTASLFAVLNSEMLQRLILVLGHHLVVESIKEYQSVNKLNLSAATQLMKEVRLFISQSCKQLTWSLEYQRLYLLDKAPPTHTSDHTSQVTNPISLIKAELHAADLHTHTTLIKLRELESNLSTDVQQIYLEEEIKAIQNNLIAAEQHLNHVIVQLHPSTTPIKSDNIIERKNEHEENIVQENIMENIIEESEDEEIEDEKVYEAYVTNIEDISLLQDQNLIVENEEWKQASVTLLRELNSVLAVRKVEKERKRETRQKLKLGDQCPMEQITVQLPDTHMTTNDTSHDPQNILSIDSTDKSHDHVTPHESQTAIHVSKHTFIHVSKQQSNPSSDSHMTNADKTHDYHVKEQDIESGRPSMQDLANAIASASKRTCEEVFEYSEDDEEENPPI